MKKPLLVQKNNKEIFSIEMNGDIILRGQKIGKDKKLANIFIGQGKAMEKVIKNSKDNIIRTAVSKGFNSCLSLIKQSLEKMK